MQAETPPGPASALCGWAPPAPASLVMVLANKLRLIKALAKCRHQARNCPFYAETAAREKVEATADSGAARTADEASAAVRKKAGSRFEDIELLQDVWLIESICK
jgi:hypothetical protein